MKVVEAKRQPFKSDIVLKALNLDEICWLLQDSDPDLEQFLAFKQHLDAGSSIYEKWLTNEKARKTKQKDMREFFCSKWSFPFEIINCFKQSVTTQHFIEHPRNNILASVKNCLSSLY